MRDERKLVYNGNSICVSIPRLFLQYLGWIPGERLVVEVLEDKTVLLRRRNMVDLAPLGAPRLVFDEHATVQK